MAFHQLDRLTFLIVDDDPDELRLLEKLVTMLGVRRVKRAIDGSEALEILRLVPVHMIICDLRMTPMDGLTFVRKLRRLKLERSVNRPNRPRGFPRVIICGSRC